MLGCNSYDIDDRIDLHQDSTYAVLHIAIPWSDLFVQAVREYQQRFEPQVTIIYSTVPIGTSEGLGAVHSPVEGQHPDLADSIRRHVRWLGSSDREKRNHAYLYWRGRTQSVIQTVDSADYTEFLKLRSTARYGINIAFAEYEYRVADEIGMPGRYLEDFDYDYNRLYKDDRKANRYVLTDPEGEIGGHCIVPNAEILYGQYPDSLLQEIIEMGGDE